MKDGKKVILHIEDDPMQILLYNRKLKRNKDCIVLNAKSIEEAEKIFEENKSIIHGIIFDGIVVGGTTIKLAEKIRSGGFTGNMMANSGDEDINKKLILAGCNLLYGKPISLKELEKIFS